MHKDTICIKNDIKYKDWNYCIQPPIYATTAYEFENIQHALDLFDLKVPGNIYSRITNPTNDILEERLAKLEGGVGALVTSSGHAANLMAILNIASCGDEIVSCATLYGGTFNLFTKTLKQMGITAHLVHSDNPEDYRKVINEKTRCIFLESVGNPQLNIPDIEGIAKVAHENNIPLIVDNTVPTGYLLRPFDFGADISVYSTTKYIAGHGAVMGGAIVDSGRFDWAKAGKFPELSEPDESYHGIVYTEAFKNAAFIAKARTHLLRDLGTCQSPLNTYITLLGLETLHIRMQRHSENALALAKYLESHPLVSWVRYPGLESHEYHKLALKYMPEGQSSLMAFGIKSKGDTVEAAKKFIENVKLLIHATNLGDTRTIVTYPAGTTHSQLSPEEKIKAGITDDFIRLSVGIENINDIKEDIDRALKIACE